MDRGSLQSDQRRRAPCGRLRDGRACSARHWTGRTLAADPRVERPGMRGKEVVSGALLLTTDNRPLITDHHATPVDHRADSQPRAALTTCDPELRWVLLVVDSRDGRGRRWHDRRDAAGTA